MGFSLNNENTGWQNNEIALYIYHKYLQIIDIFPTSSKNFILSSRYDTNQNLLLVWSCYFHPKLTINQNIKPQDA